MPAMASAGGWYTTLHEGISQLPERGGAGQAGLLQVGQHDIPAPTCFSLLCITRTCGQHGAASQQVRVAQP